MTCQTKTFESELPEDADDRYALAVELLGSTLGRLAAGYEADPAERQDLLQNIHFQLWSSLKSFDGRCSLRTWTYRVAPNVAADHVARARRWNHAVDLDDLEKYDPVDPLPSPEMDLVERQALSRAYAILERLGPIDRQVMILYLEDESAATIAEVSGLSAGAVATRVHRVKRLIADRFNMGGA
ncbi:RNA polymerase sigma factor [Rhizobium sp. 2YAF20]|uniref:RNA polymerase sigma factor n=1 Tax=Rhizobium sp. 2YAF20 TaxID=3233027 RepID=UPI003F99CD60